MTRKQWLWNIGICFLLSPVIIACICYFAVKDKWFGGELKCEK